VQPTPLRTSLVAGAQAAITVPFLGRFGWDRDELGTWRRSAAGCPAARGLRPASDEVGCHLLRSDTRVEVVLVLQADASISVL